ncbi:MAG TPA: FAD-binding oxidoreductase [Solirubrobacteraceae bacterium]|nr:FAD-binding oxidoreductase [Solirubrobacteraceae bacterium]
MRHDRHGWWIEEAGAPGLLAPLRGETQADVVVLGGGFTGLWAAWHLALGGASVVLLEAGRCGFGPSGRNGGFVSTLALNAPSLREAFGAQRARALVAASIESVRGIGAWCLEQGVDAWYRYAPHLVVSCAPAQDGVSADAVDAAEVVTIDAAAARAVCDSPLFRGGVLARTGATVHPARLAFGLRARLLERGVAVHERSRVRRLSVGAGGAVAEVAGGGVVRAGAAVVAVGARSGALEPLRRRLTVSSSHIVLTEPVPDVVQALGWDGGEAITDGRALLHYFRTTGDGRIVFGWAGGRMAAGGRARGRMELDARAAAQVRADLVRFFPALEGRRVERAWGGPIDVSPTHLPAVVTLPGGRAWAAFGYTGNGVGPSHLAGRALAALALGGPDPAASLALVDPPARAVPPEPVRVAGATVLRGALVRTEGAAEQGRCADPLSRALAALPERLGLHIVR